jgi:DNA mismatch endonuclease (patch repair protein)
MQGNRKRDTKPELALRRELHRRGLRYRVDTALPLPGFRRRGDVVFTRRRLVVFVDGCFWHGCEMHGTTPNTNATYWRAKITRNQERDLDTDRRLGDAGWSVLRIWEHEDASTAADRVATILTQVSMQRGTRIAR